MTAMQKQGYDDQAAGMLNAALAEADTPAGREYRDGARACRRDQEENITAEERAARGIAVAPISDPFVVSTPKCKACEGDGVNSRGDCCVPCGGRGYAAIMSDGPAVVPDPARIGGAFDVAPAAEKKPRKAKPVDDGQASFL